MGSNDLYTTDEELFTLISQGDEAAFEQFFYRYVPLLQPVIQKIVKSEVAMHDIMQDIFLDIWISRDKLTEVISPSRWIFRMMYNHSLTWVERRSVRENAARMLSPGNASNNHTEEAVSFAETSRLVQEAIRQLPPQTKKIYQLSRESGLKIPEIAEQLGLSPSTVKNTLVRAGKMIRDYLAAHGVLVPLLLFTLSYLFFGQ